MSNICTDNRLITSDVLGKRKITCQQESVFIPTNMKQQKGLCILQMFPVFHHYMKRNPAKNFDYNRGVYMYFVSF